MDLMYLMYSLLRKKWIIFLCFILGLVAGFIFTLFQQKAYVSLAQYSTGFTMEQRVKIKQEETFNIYEIDLRFNNVIQTFKSPTVIAMLSYKLLLHDLEEKRPFRHLKDDKKTKDTVLLANKEKIMEILRTKINEMKLISPYDREEKKVWDLLQVYGYNEEALAKKLDFQRVPNSDFINIFFRSENPELSAYAVNTIGAQFIRFYNYIYGVRTLESTAKLDSLTNTKKREVDSLNEKLKDFRDKIGTPNVADRAMAAMEVVTAVISDYQREMTRLNNLGAELRAVEQQLKTLNSSISNTPVNNGPQILALRKKNEQLQISLDGKSDEEKKTIQDEIDENNKKAVQLTSANNPNRLKINEKNNDRMAELIDKKIELQQQIAAAQSNVNMLRQQKNSYEKITSTGGGEEVILNAKETELRIATLEYERLKTGLQASQDIDVNPVSNFKQIYVGQPAYKADSSRRMLIVGLAGMAALFLSCFLILLLEFLDPSFKTPSLFQRATKLKMLSTINRVDLRKRKISDYFNSNGEVDLKENANLFVENLRKLRYELEKSGKKVFLVTSTRPKEGKTTIIEALANSLSLTKNKVLLIDANFSNNSLTDDFQAKPLLDQYSVNGQASPKDRFLMISSKTAIPNIDIVGCKEGNFTPSEVLPKNNLLENLKNIAGDYDYVLVEGAALNTHADSKELSKYVDGIIAVFSARSVLRQTDRESIQYLKSTGDKFIGSVLNNIEEENMDL